MPWRGRLPRREREPGRHGPLRHRCRARQRVPLQHLRRGHQVGIVISDSASDDQVSALERIFKGDEGGPFGELSALYGEWLGTEKGSVSFSDGDRPSYTLGDASVTFEPLEAPGGSHTTVKGAAFGFAPEFRIGRGAGKVSALGIEFDGEYGETADFEFSSEQAPEAPRGR